MDRRPEAQVAPTRAPGPTEAEAMVPWGEARRGEAVQAGAATPRAAGLQAADLRAERRERRERREVQPAR